jgi:quinoprotein glucose dehydrogenase
VLALVALILIGWVGVSYWAAGQAGDGVGFSDMMPMVGEMVVGTVKCQIFECKAEAVEGMTVTTWASSEITGSTPVAIDVDEYGRVYVAEGDRVFGGAEDNRQHDERWLLDDLASRSVEDRRAYYQKYVDDGTIDAGQFTARSDFLSVLEDTDGDGMADSRRVIAEFNDAMDGIAAGVLAENGTVWMTEIPAVYRFDDTDGDGVADAKQTLSSGYGVKTSLQGHDLHGLVWGPDGKLYYSMGDRGYRIALPDGRVLEDVMGGGRGAVFRMNPDGSDLEIFATGVRNPQELAFDDHGNLFTGDNNGDGGDLARVVYLVEGGETGWAMPYQTLVGDYIRGPWVAERLWETHHETRPAWVVPPVGHLSSGPSGFAHYPGLGLPERFRDHFFLCDYRYQPSVSNVWAFAVEPKGAGFALGQAEAFVGNVIPTDVDFSWDGRIFVSHFSQFGGSQQIVTVRHDEAASDPRIAEVTALAQQGMAGRDDTELMMLLGHADQRIRLRAQRELAKRGNPTPFAAVLSDPEAAVLARIHAVWGLGQLGASALTAAGWEDLAWAAVLEPELRAQIARVAGDAGATGLAPELIPWLNDENPRVQFFAAQALGALGERAAVAPLYALAEQNADADPWLRHAIVYALHRIADLDATLARTSDPSRSVRLVALLELRRAQHPAIARFLADEDPLLVVEAARAIYDLPIAEAMPSLAALAGTALPYRDEDPQTSGALHRRVIGAARTVGTEAAALALAAHAADPSNPRNMRELALTTLGEFTKPGPRDLAMGWYRPLAARPQSIVHAAFDVHGKALVEGDLADTALEVASAYGRVPLDDDQLAAIVADAQASSGRRVAALGALAGRNSAGINDAIGTAVASDDPELRSTAREFWVTRSPADVLRSVQKIADDAPLPERQRALGLAYPTVNDAVVAHLGAQFDRLEAGTLDVGLELDLIEAAERSGDPELIGRARAIGAGSDLVAARRYAQAGGDPEAGKQIFEGNGDCRRCHGGSGHGAGVGPDLAGVSDRGAAYILESVLLPQVEIAEGFATVAVTRTNGEIVTGTVLEDGDELVLDVAGDRVSMPPDQVASRTNAVSGMPPMGLTLAPRDLRDLIAYVMTL